MNLRDLIRLSALFSLAAGLFALSKSTLAASLDEFLAPLLTALSVGLVVQAIIYLMTKIQFGVSMAALIGKARDTSNGSAIIFASIVAFMIALMVLFTGMLS